MLNEPTKAFPDASSGLHVNASRDFGCNPSDDFSLVWCALVANASVVNVPEVRHLKLGLTTNIVALHSQEVKFATTQMA